MTPTDENNNLESLDDEKYNQKEITVYIDRAGVKNGWIRVYLAHWEYYALNILICAVCVGASWVQYFYFTDKVRDMIRNLVCNFPLPFSIYTSRPLFINDRNGSCSLTGIKEMSKPTNACHELKQDESHSCLNTHSERPFIICICTYQNILWLGRALYCWVSYHEVGDKATQLFSHTSMIFVFWKDDYFNMYQ